MVKRYFAQDISDTSDDWKYTFVASPDYDKLKAWAEKKIAEAYSKLMDKDDALNYASRIMRELEVSNEINEA